MKYSDVSNLVIGCAIRVHRHLGPGLLESTYQQCLAHELRLNNVRFSAQHPVPVQYRGHRIDCAYRIDLLVEDQVIFELKSVERLLEIHKAQLLTYLKLTGVRHGFLINFNVPRLKDGLVSLVL